jgi:hypothetical protein
MEIEMRILSALINIQNLFMEIELETYQVDRMEAYFQK